MQPHRPSHFPALSLALLLGLCVPALSAADSSSPPFPPFTIAHTQIRTLPPTPDGRHYELDVALPESYATHPHRRYPVIYVTDGYWDFPTLQSSYANLVYDRLVPECIIVGLSYVGRNLDYNDLRRWELSPVKMPAPGGPSGHAAGFLHTIEHVIIPFVQQEYRVDSSFRVLAGSSLGGLFTLYAMYTRPGLFQGYIAASPDVREGHDWLLGYEEAFARSGRPLPARLYVTTAEWEWPSFRAAIERYHERLLQRHYPGFSWKFRLVDGVRHAGTKAISYVRGMEYVLAPRAPESGPSKD